MLAFPCKISPKLGLLRSMPLQSFEAISAVVACCGHGLLLTWLSFLLPISQTHNDLYPLHSLPLPSCTSARVLRTSRFTNACSASVLVGCCSITNRNGPCYDGMHYTLPTEQPSLPHLQEVTEGHIHLQNTRPSSSQVHRCQDTIHLFHLQPQI